VAAKLGVADVLGSDALTAEAIAYLSDQRVADRCELVEGDSFSSVPSDGDV
jgi:hypothetical protein